jgi:chorismate mutase
LQCEEIYRIKTILRLESCRKGTPYHFGSVWSRTEEQVLNTAGQLAATNKIKIFRAGIWKPRTRPNAFEGVGEIGLKWLQQVKKQYGLLTTVEVANREHTELALKYGVDILWIGARTTVNPFSVQEIADVLKGVDVPVMIKNPVNPDLQLWIGAIERINQAGINKIAAIHRGFHSGNKTIYRNNPMWEIPIELKHCILSLQLFATLVILEEKEL